jgi:hypothetical protein
MMDEYRRGWALRYLREAKAELEAARKMPYMAPSLVLESIRKARNAIYYSLGEPAFIEVLIREEVEKTKPHTRLGSTFSHGNRRNRAAADATGGGKRRSNDAASGHTGPDSHRHRRDSD